MDLIFFVIACLTAYGFGYLHGHFRGYFSANQEFRSRAVEDGLAEWQFGTYWRWKPEVVEAIQKADTV